MATSKWTAYTTTAATILSTEFNSLANLGVTAAGTAFDNTSNLDMMADFELNLAAQGSARSAGANIALYLSFSLDGTNYTDALASVAEPVGAFTLDAATNARRAAIRGVSLSPGKFKAVAENRTGQAFAASGTVLTVRFYNVATN